MHRILISLLLVGVAAPLFAGPAEERAAAGVGRKEAIALMRQGKFAESKTRLGSSLPVGGSVAANELALGRQWVIIAFDVYARGEIPIARQAALEAVAVAVSASRNAGISPERASLLSNTGLVCERVLRNVAQAKTFYDAALVAHPTSQHAKQLQRIAEERLKRSAVDKRS